MTRALRWLTRARRALCTGALFVMAATSCRNIHDPEPVHIGSPTATVTAEAIIERYRNDRELAEELYKGNLVHIKRFRVDKSGSLYLRMIEKDFTLRLDHPSDTDKIKKGAIVKLYCEGEGLKEKDGVTFIRFNNCRGRLGD